MKPSPIIQLIVIFFGISATFSGISYLISNGIFTTVGLLEKNSYGIGSPSIYLLIIMFAFIFLGLFVVTKSSDISSFITSKSGYSNELKVITDTKEVLCVFIIFLALSQLLTHLPYFVSGLFDFFTAGVKKSELSDLYQERKKVDWIVSILEILLPILMIIFCRNISNYFGKNLDMAATFHIEEPDQIDITKEEN